MLFSLLEVDGTTINTVVGIVGIIVTIAFGLPAVISGLVFIIRRLNINKFYDAFLNEIFENKNDLNWHHFLHYVKHFFTFEELTETKKDRPYKEFIKTVKSTKIVILIGNAGIGKSILMQRLALTFRKKLEKGVKGEKLEDYGILFKKLSRSSKLDEILNKVEEEIDRSSGTYSLFFDGLDEVSALRTQDGSELLKDLLDRFTNDNFRKCNRIFISLRPEILNNGYSFIHFYEEENIKVFKLQNFNNNQIMTMYRREKRSHYTRLKYKERKQNLQKLKAVINNNPQSVFTYPLILTWADEILSDCTIQQLKHISWFDALGKVIEKELIREYRLELKGNTRGPIATQYPPDQLMKNDKFINEGKEFITDIALKMALSANEQVTQEAVLANQIVQQFNAAQNETTGNTFLTRRLLRYVEWSEKENSQPHYEFLHNTIYWRVLAGALINPTTPQHVRAEIISKQAKNKFATHLLQYCHQGLWSVYGNNVFPYVDYFAYMRAVGIKIINCKIKDNPIPLEVLLSCFYGFNDVYLDNSIRFSFSQINDFVEDRKINLSNTPITDLSILNYFGKNSFEVLDCSNSNVIKAEIPDYVKEIKFEKCKSLKGIFITDLSAWCNIIVSRWLWPKDVNLYFNGELVTDLVIPNGVSIINNEVFSQCPSLERIVLPDSLTEIGDNAFSSCTSLVNVKIPDGVKNIGRGAFTGCSSLSNIIIPNSVESIGAEAFWQCHSLERIVLPNNLIDIADDTFRNCASLVNVKIPDGVKNIGRSAFAGCSSLTNIIIPDSVVSIGEHAFSQCSSLTYITIPDNVENIGWAAFMECTAIKKLTIGKGVNKIGNSAFENCTGLTEIFFNATACNLGKDCDVGTDDVFFENAGICESGITVNIGANVKKIPVGIFLTNRYADTHHNKPHKIIKVNFAANSVCERICAYAFCGCALIEDIVLPDSIKTIGSNAFSNCDMLKKVHLGASFESMVYAFPLCKSLIEISVSSDNKNFKSIAGILYSFDGKTIIRFPSGKLDTSFNVPKNVKRIGDWAFEGCSRLKDITLPDGIMSIGAWAFGRTAYYENEDNWEDGILYINKHLIETKEKLSENYKIKTGILTIAKNAFRFHNELESITFPDSVTSIGECAFFGCKRLTSVSIPESVKFIDKAAFAACDALVKITVNSNNKYYKSIDGNLYSVDSKAFIQYAAGKSESSFCVPDSVTSFSDYVFRDCHLTSVTLPDGVATISESMFEGCRELASITIPDSVTSIGERAFACCSGLTNLIIPGKVKKIGDGAFYGCSSLTSIILPDSVERIAKMMVAECSKLTSIIIPDGVTVVDDEAFFNCWSLININIPESVTYIYLSAFSCNYSPPKSEIKVRYDGVIEKWNSIEKNYIIDFSFCRVKEIECTDGSVKIK